MAWRNGDELGKPAISIAPDQHTVLAEMCLADPAVKARPAIQLRIDNHAVARA
jgi:hypothetical protein